MSREILFKGFHESFAGSAKIYLNNKWIIGEWIEGSLIIAENFCCILEQVEPEIRYDYPYLDGGLGTIDGKAITVIPKTISQFTGLTDVNNQKIWENDIVLAHDNLGSFTAQVRWCEEHAQFVLGKAAFCLGDFDYFEREVVGNIFDGSVTNGKM